jgi:hypothetical protein
LFDNSTSQAARKHQHDARDLGVAGIVQAQLMELDQDQRAKRRKSYSSFIETLLLALEDSMANAAPRNNRLMPWYIGIVIILAAVIFVGYRMGATSCPAPTIIEIGVLTVIPVVYLMLMYLTLISQK